MEDCVFCKIVKGELPSSVIYEDATTLAFLSIRPINPGHVVVIPKSHLPNSHELDEDSYLKLMSVVRRVSIAINDNLRPTKVGLMISGFDVPHCHVHVVPLIDEDDITSKKSLDGTLLVPSRDELQEIAASLKNELKA